MMAKIFLLVLVSTSSAAAAAFRVKRQVIPESILAASTDDPEIYGLIVMPLLIIGSALMTLASIAVYFTGRRALSDGPRHPDFVAELHDELERLFNKYVDAFVSQECSQRIICDVGVYSRDLQGRDILLGLIEPLVPDCMKNNVAVFREAAESGYETGMCKKFKCVPPKIL
ncbi:uncharacterized protein [Cherax quadricarinatus]|uniref:uncharacterized protein n=1 Tax=Cherax quadricarinatus TaxID=27406 RepID=UPI002378B59C|nr:uncharacterized protein LOC128689651 [Cherax quadricarinatus]